MPSLRWKAAVSTCTMVLRFEPGACAAACAGLLSPFSNMGTGNVASISAHSCDVAAEFARVKLRVVGHGVVRRFRVGV